MVANEAAEAKRAAGRAEAGYRSTQSTVLALAGVAILLWLVALLWLVRDIVPRIRRYSDFATQVASGTPVEPIKTRGSDELATSGAGSTRW